MISLLVTRTGSAGEVNNTTKDHVLAYITSMKNNRQVLSGQHCGDGQNITTDYGTMMGGLFALTGKYAAIVGADYGYIANNNLSAINSKIIEHWNGGGLVEISWHAGSPWKSRYNCRCNSVKEKGKINLSALLKNAPASPAKTSYRSELSKVAIALRQLKDAGVIVIWRPFHEMNGNWFWWGINAYNGKQTNVQAYVDLWKDLYDTLTIDYGLNNLIWVYSPGKYAAWGATVTAYYPGSGYVDLVGEDVYEAVGNIPDYDELCTLGKPIVLSECGPDKNSYGAYDEAQMVSNIVGKACYFLQWHSWTKANCAIKDNVKAIEMMNSASVISRDEVQRNAWTRDERSLAPSSKTQ